MSTVPSNVTSGLTAVQTDSDALASAQAALVQAQAALAAAQSAVQAAQGNATNALSKLSQDYQSFLTLLASTYEPPAITTTTTPAPAPAPAP